MLVMPGMARVVMTPVMMHLSMMLSVRVGKRMMVVLSVMRPGTPLDLLKRGMQHHGHVQRFRVSHVQTSHFRPSHG